MLAGQLELDDLSSKALKDRCRCYKLKVSGKKEELRERIREYLESTHKEGSTGAISDGSNSIPKPESFAEAVTIGAKISIGEAFPRLSSKKVGSAPRRTLLSSESGSLDAIGADIATSLPSPRANSDLNRGVACTSHVSDGSDPRPAAFVGSSPPEATQTSDSSSPLSLSVAASSQQENTLSKDADAFLPALLDAATNVPVKIVKAPVPAYDLIHPQTRPHKRRKFTGLALQINTQGPFHPYRPRLPSVCPSETSNAEAKRAALAATRLDILKNHWVCEYLNSIHSEATHRIFKYLIADVDCNARFQHSISAFASILSHQALDQNLLFEVTKDTIDPQPIRVCALNPDMSELQTVNGGSSVFLSLTGEYLGPDIATIRFDWLNLAYHHGLNMESVMSSILDLIEYRSHRDEDAHWRHGISSLIPPSSPRYLVAARFVLTNAALQAPFHPTALPKFILDANKGVLSVHLTSEAAPWLRTGIALVTTTDGRTSYVLSDTGRIVGNEDDGIDLKCQELLNCDHRGAKRSTVYYSHTTRA